MLVILNGLLIFIFYLSKGRRVLENTKADKDDKLSKDFLKEARETISLAETALLYSKDSCYQDDSVKKTMKETIQDIRLLSFKIENEHSYALKSNLCNEMLKKLNELGLLSNDLSLSLLHTPIKTTINTN